MAKKKTVKKPSNKGTKKVATRKPASTVKKAAVKAIKSPKGIVKKEEVKVNPYSHIKDLTFHKVSFPVDQYYKVSYEKSQIYLHHTVSGAGIGGDINHWLSTASRIATCIIIDRDGEVWQCFSSKYWAHHLGVRVKVFNAYRVEYKIAQTLRGDTYYANNELLNQRSIGVELDSWGFLEGHNGQYSSYTSELIDEENIQTYNRPYRGEVYYEKYTKKQIETLRGLLLYWNGVYGIPLDYNEDMWNVSKDALEGKAGIWSHTSVRPDKSDVHPQPDLIEMLKGLKS